MKSFLYSKYGYIILAFIGIVILDMSIKYFHNKWTFSTKVKYWLVRMWGQIPERKYLSWDFNLFHQFYEYAKNKYKPTHIIDDITWNDLNMNKIFARMNYTITTAGASILYTILRIPLFDEEKLKERDRYIDYFSSDEKERMNIQKILLQLGEEDSINLVQYVLESHEIKSLHKNIYITLSISLMISIIGMVFGIIYFVPLFVILLLANIVIYSNFNKKNGVELEAFKYVLKLMTASNKIRQSNIGVIKPLVDDLKESYQPLKGMYRQLSIVLKSVEKDFTSFLKIFFLLEPIGYENSKKIIEEHKESILGVYETLGKIDAYISIASYRQSLPFYTKPLLNTEKTCHIGFDDLYHPLIKNPVSNSIDTQDSILITGSNATGKSTFLRTVALNAILAQTIYTCNANRFQSAYYKVYTSMALKDDLLGGESYFIVEIKSLKRILDGFEENIPVLCFVDEILRGTNTIERIAGSCQVLKSIQQKYGLCFAATHDLELTDLLKNQYSNYHFQEQIKDDKILFDYKIYEGKTNSKNALKLLEIMGYDKKILEDAYNMIDKFLKNHKWIG